MSDHKNLWEALAAFQAEAPTLPKDAENPHFKSKFTPLDTIVETIKPLLATHGLVWVTLPSTDDEGRPVLKYKLVHAPSGDYIEDAMPLLLSKQDAQGMGSALTYSRRYATTAVLNLVADDDDDGNGASRPSRPQAQSAPATQATGNGQRLASAKQRGLIFVRAQENGLSNKQLADVVLAVTGSPAREFDTDEAAGEWLRRAMERLPAEKVTPIVEAVS